MSWCIILCYVMVWYAVLCYGMLCCVMTCYNMLCYVVRCLCFLLCVVACLQLTAFEEWWCIVCQSGRTTKADHTDLNMLCYSMLDYIGFFMYVMLYVLCVGNSKTKTGACPSEIARSALPVSAGTRFHFDTQLCVGNLWIWDKCMSWCVLTPRYPTAANNNECLYRRPIALTLPMPANIDIREEGGF